MKPPMNNVLSNNKRLDTFVIFDIYLSSVFSIFVAWIKTLWESHTAFHTQHTQAHVRAPTEKRNSAETRCNTQYNIQLSNRDRQFYVMKVSFYIDSPAVPAEIFPFSRKNWCKLGLWLMFMVITNKWIERQMIMNWTPSEKPGSGLSRDH